MSRSFTRREALQITAEAGFEATASDGPPLDRLAVRQHGRWSDFVKKTGVRVDE